MADKGLKLTAGSWAKSAQLLVWAYVKGNWMHWNERVHGAGRVERQAVHREGMRRKALALFGNRPPVGATGQHLFDDRERVAKMSYRYQKAWLWSVQVESIRRKMSSSPTAHRRHRNKDGSSSSNR